MRNKVVDELRGSGEGSEILAPHAERLSRKVVRAALPGFRKKRAKRRRRGERFSKTGSRNGLVTRRLARDATQSARRNRRRCLPSGRSSTTISPSRSVALCVATPCVLSGAGNRTERARRELAVDQVSARRACTAACGVRSAFHVTWYSRDASSCMLSRAKLTGWDPGNRDEETSWPHSHSATARISRACPSNTGSPKKVFVPHARTVRVPRSRGPPVRGAERRVRGDGADARVAARPRRATSRTSACTQCWRRRTSRPRERRRPEPAARRRRRAPTPSLLFRRRRRRRRVSTTASAASRWCGTGARGTRRTTRRCTRACKSRKARTGRLRRLRPSGSPPRRSASRALREVLERPRPGLAM